MLNQQNIKPWTSTPSSITPVDVAIEELKNYEPSIEEPKKERAVRPIEIIQKQTLDRVLDGVEMPAGDNVLVFSEGNKIFVIENGEIIERGTHEQLIEKKGKYAHMFNTQAEGYK